MNIYRICFFAHSVQSKSSINEISILLPYVHLMTPKLRLHVLNTQIPGSVWGRGYFHPITTMCTWLQILKWKLILRRQSWTWKKTFTTDHFRYSWWCAKEGGSKLMNATVYFWELCHTNKWTMRSAFCYYWFEEDPVAVEWLSKPGATHFYAKTTKRHQYKTDKCQGHSLIIFVPTSTI